MPLPLPPARRYLRAAPHAPPTLARRGHRAAASQRLQFASSLLTRSSRQPLRRFCRTVASPRSRRAVAAHAHVASPSCSTISDSRAPRVACHVARSSSNCMVGRGASRRLEPCANRDSNVASCPEGERIQSPLRVSRWRKLGATAQARKPQSSLAHDRSAASRIRVPAPYIVSSASQSGDGAELSSSESRSALRVARAVQQRARTRFESCYKQMSGRIAQSIGTTYKSASRSIRSANLHVIQRSRSKRANSP